MFGNFDHTVERTPEKTVITVKNCRYKEGILLLTKSVKKFAHWSSGTEVNFWGEDRMLNGGANFTITIPAPKNPRHTRDPFTKEYVSGYFTGIKEFLDRLSSKELSEEIARDLES